MIPQESLASLMRLLDLEEEGWRGLLHALNQEAQAVKSQDLEAINSSIQKKGEAISNLSLTLEEKGRLLNDIARKLNLSTPLRWEVLLSHVSPEQGQELTARQEKFAAFAQEVKEKNQENAVLIEAALHVVGDSLQFLRRLLGEETHYDHGGNVSARPLHGKIVSERG